MKNLNENLLNFLKETLQRLFTKSPKYFVIWQAIAFAAMLITGIPEILQDNGVVLPPFLSFLSNETVAWIAGAILTLSKLTTQSTPILTDSGEIVKQTNVKALPFTAKAEEKTISDKTN